MLADIAAVYPFATSNPLWCYILAEAKAATDGCGPDRAGLVDIGLADAAAHELAAATGSRPSRSPRWRLPAYRYRRANSAAMSR